MLQIIRLQISGYRSASCKYQAADTDLQIIRCQITKLQIPSCRCQAVSIKPRMSSRKYQATNIRLQIIQLQISGCKIPSRALPGPILKLVFPGSFAARLAALLAPKKPCPRSQPQRSRSGLTPDQAPGRKCQDDIL